MVAMRLSRFLLVFVGLFFGNIAHNPAVAEAPQTPGVYIIYDSSNSMWGELADGSRKYETARQVLADYLKEGFPGKALALRAYGHRRKDDCRDSELIAPFMDPGTVPARVQTRIEGLTPKGRTPIDWSLRQALKDFGGRSGDIILISDGIESCDADPCALARDWAQRNVDIKIHVVGLGLDDKARAAMTCIADASGTVYRDAQSAEDLAEGLQGIKEAAGDAVFRIVPSLDNGAPVYAFAEMIDPDGTVTKDIGSDSRIVTIPGMHRFRIGVKTRNGVLYQPVSVSATAVKGRETDIRATLPEPPQVSAVFLMDGQPHPGALIRAYRDDREVFNFRPDDTVYLLEGDYTFRATVGDQTLSVMHSFTAGTKAVLTFEMAQRVTAVLKFVASQTNEDMAHNFDLYRNGNQVAFGHSRNGVTAAPGSYELRFRNALTPFVMADFMMPQDDGTTQTIVVPAGHLHVTLTLPDGRPSRDNTFHIARIGADGKPKGRRVYGANDRHAFLPGRYRVTPRFSDDTPATIDIEEGQTYRLAFTVSK